MMSSSNGNIFRNTGPLCGEFTGHRWISLTKASKADLWFLSLICSWTNGGVNNRDACDLRHHRASYDVTAMIYIYILGVSLEITGYAEDMSIDMSLKIIILRLNSQFSVTDELMWQVCYRLAPHMDSSQWRKWHYCSPGDICWGMSRWRARGVGGMWTARVKFRRRRACHNYGLYLNYYPGTWFLLKPSRCN